jgi:hypothetical protein
MNMRAVQEQQKSGRFPALAFEAALRHGHLLRIFYYRNPKSRARRIDKMLGEASAIAERARERSG